MPLGIEELLEEYGLLPLLTLVAAPVIAFVIARAVFGRSASPLAVTSVRRTKVVLCGPCGSGKTTIWQKLVNGDVKATHTSMVANVGNTKAADGSTIMSGTVKSYDADGRLTSTLSFGNDLRYANRRLMQAAGAVSP